MTHSTLRSPIADEAAASQLDAAARLDAGTSGTELTAQWEGKRWTITVRDHEVVIDSDGASCTLTDEQVTNVSVSRSWWRWELRNDGHRVALLPGLNRQNARRIEGAVRRLRYASELAAAQTWCNAAIELLQRSSTTSRWVARESVDELLRSRPVDGLSDRIHEAGLDGALSDEERQAVSMLDINLRDLVDRTNNEILQAELVAQRHFFDTIERSPLTNEQARAVVCFDNRVHVVAAAGSGKTSVMVARSGYAIHRGFVPADRILLLAFNRAAAAELQERIESRLTAAGIDPAGLRASTFHAFGLETIGKATGKKPRLAPWLDGGQDSVMVQRIVDELRDSSPTFRYKWDLYRLLFAGAPTRVEAGDPDAYDTASSRTGFRTFKGEVVKSEGERLIANWLYLNGVDYLYEAPYSIDVADATHSQYRPDFYYPSIQTWHEHWGVDRNGTPPAAFSGYAESMKWKQDLHYEHGTPLIETTWGDVMFGSGLDDLAQQLTGRGIVLDWNPDRPIAGMQPTKHATLAQLVRTFMAHVKSNSLTSEELSNRLGGNRRHLAGYRTQLFLDVYWPVHAEWDRRLSAGNYVDFEDMMVVAADCLESGVVDQPYDLVMVDEFQDASQARARLVRGLVKEPGKYLLAVGDDWQSINRFAGADISAMTEFSRWFGDGPELQLTATFRCPQSICDVASAFVSKNPRQLDKTVRSTQTEPGPLVTLVRSKDPKAAVAKYLTALSADVTAGQVAPNHHGPLTVLVLGRYKFDRDILPPHLPPNLDITFRTAHGSKGLEADYVIVPRLAAGTYGFPSNIADDPVLDLAMSDPDDYPHAEERRLLYVALTRARRHVTLIAQEGRESPFFVELIEGKHIEVVDDDGDAVAGVSVCSRCKQGTMVPRVSKYGPFYGCSTFPACKNKQKSA